MSTTAILKGLGTFVPGLYDLVSNRRTGGTTSARYCYSVWLRHLTRAWRSGFQSIPQTVAELGPGDSLGIGLSALLCGAETYYALDAVDYADRKRNLAIFDELVELFRARAPIPGPDEFPETKPLLDDYSFPATILSQERLAHTLAPERLDWIRAALAGSGDAGEIRIVYHAPWDAQDVDIEAGSVDMIYSQAVFEHITALEEAYRTLFRWLRPEGLLSNTIDFRAHGTSDQWNGHWAYSDLTWRLIRGRRRYPVCNREPLSTHLELMERVGFRIVEMTPTERRDGIRREQLAPRFDHVSEQDLITSDVFVQATRE